MWLLSAPGKPGGKAGCKAKLGKVTALEQMGWQGGIKEAHSWAHACPLTLTGLPFFCQMKIWRLTSPVSPASQDTSRILPPLQPAANPIPGESTPFPSFPQLQEAQLLAFPASLTPCAPLAIPCHVFLEHQVPRRAATAHTPVSSTDVRTRAWWRRLQAPPALTPSVEINPSQV